MSIPISVIATNTGGAISYQIVKFVDCCDGIEILFRGTISLTGTNVYQFIGPSTFPGTGGELIPNRCYTVSIEIVNQEPTHPLTPSLVLLNQVDTNDCFNDICADCNPTGDCNCEEGFIYDAKNNECIKTVETAAEYSGNLLPIVAGSKSQFYCDFGIRVYPDITSLAWPLYGQGNPTYVVNQNNGSGALVNPTNNVQNNAFGSSVSGCTTGNTGGRLNKAGIWATGFGTNRELSFDFCIDIEGTVDKQYMIGIAGDNYVKFYIDGILAVFLDASGSPVPIGSFRYWHTFPLTLSPGNHTIKLSGLDLGTPAAFAAEIYDITLPNFIANLLIPAVGSGNCGSTEAQLEPYIIFSTRDYIGQSIPDPNVPGEWSCPDGSLVDYCQGVPVCTLIEKVALECTCYLIIPCDGTTPFNSYDVSYEIYLNSFTEVDGPEYTGCAYITQDETLLCNDSSTTTVPTGVTCDCELSCYFVQGGNGFFYVEGKNDEFLFIPSIDVSPYLRICSKIPPIPQQGSDIDNFKAKYIGECIGDSCPDLCFKLQSCDPGGTPGGGEVIYSNSDVLLQYTFGTDSVVEILGREGCWLVSLEADPTTSDCECLIDIVVVRSYSECSDCIKIPAYRLKSCVDTNVIYVKEKEADLPLEDAINKVIKTDCGCYTVELIDFEPVNTQTIILEGIYDDCISCTRPYYELVDCKGEADNIYTYTDLSSVVGDIIKIENCTECWTVVLVTAPDLVYATAGEVVITDTYDFCSECGEPTVCTCSQVTNYSETLSRTYQYLNCDNELASITLEPGESSGRICLLKWIEETDNSCDCFLVVIRIGDVQDSVVFTASPTGNFLNGYPTYNLEAFGQGTFDIYTVAVIDGAWVISLGDPNDLNNILYYIPGRLEKCPGGIQIPGSKPPQVQWEIYGPEPGLGPVSTVCGERCDCILATIINEQGEFSVLWNFVGFDAFGFAIYQDGSGNLITYNRTWYYILNGVSYLLEVKDAPCPVGPWSSHGGGTMTSEISDLCPPTPGIEFSFLPTDFFETFGDCQHGVCPPRTFPNKRVITPGYNTPICTPEKYDMITCNFADVMYNIVLEKRYGITTCCPEEIQKWMIKKELIDLQALKDPDYKCSECSYNCNSTNQCSTCKSRN